MKCPICDGKGSVYNALGDYNEDCGHCQGTGRVRVEGEPMTEQEWIQTADTEQLAEWLRGIYWHCHEIDCEHCNYPWRCMEKGDIVVWLKQPHTKEGTK